MNSPEQVPDTLSDEQANELAARGAAQIETNDVENLGRLVPPNRSDTLNAINDPVEHMVESDQTRFDALEAVKSGSLDGIADPVEKAALAERFRLEGQKGLESMVEALQKKVTTGTVDTEQLAGYVAEQNLGTNAKDTLKMEMGTLAAKKGIESAFTQAATATPETSNQ